MRYGYYISYGDIRVAKEDSIDAAFRRLHEIVAEIMGDESTACEFANAMDCRRSFHITETRGA